MESNAPFSVLIADGDDAFRDFVKRHLGGAVVVVGEACDGEEAVAMARRIQPDVVLMDAAMPILSGVEAARRIKADRMETRVILLTSAGSTPQLDGSGRRDAEAAILHADAVLPKQQVVSELLSEELASRVWDRRLRR